MRADTDLLRRHQSVLFQDAAAGQGKVFFHTLKRGLRVAIKVHEGQITVGIARRGVFPSPTEWRVIQEHLPAFTSALGEPKQAERAGWRWL